MRIHIGTSGYNYPEWRGSFYPEGFSTTKMFAYYAERFRTVEINATSILQPWEEITDAIRYNKPKPSCATISMIVHRVEKPRSK